MQRLIDALLLGLTLCGWPLLAADAPPVRRAAPPFAPGEKLTYQLKWSGISVGAATLEVLPFEDFKGRPAWHFTMVASTNAFADCIYKVRDDMHSWCARDLSRALHGTKKQREGKNQDDCVLTFDWTQFTAQATWTDETRDPVKIKEGTLDPLGVLYAFRCYQITGPGTMEQPVTDGKRVVQGKIAVVRREKVTVAGTTYDTWLVEPDMAKVGGVFKKSRGAKLQIWFTADERCLPVKVTSKVAVGSFTGQLLSVLPGTPPPAPVKP